jgi:hypothetical protein
MRTSASAVRHENPGIVYRVACQNPGCGHTFDLPITPKRVGMLAGTLACPRCSRHGGMLKSSGRLSERLFSARLDFKVTGVGPTPHSEERDLLTDLA